MSHLATFTLKDLRRDIGKRWETGTGFTTKPDGHELGDIELTIDLESVARLLGRKAMRNSRGKSTVMDGKIVARVVKRTRVPA